MILDRNVMVRIILLYCVVMLVMYCINCKLYNPALLTVPDQALWTPSEPIYRLHYLDDDDEAATQLELWVMIFTGMPNKSSNTHILASLGASRRM